MISLKSHYQSNPNLGQTAQWINMLNGRNRRTDLPDSSTDFAGFASKQYPMQGFFWTGVIEFYPLLANYPLPLKIAEV
jgi:hypothetical protein